MLQQWSLKICVKLGTKAGVGGNSEGKALDWKAHFAEVATSCEETDFMRQVEKTVHKQPIAESEFEAQITAVRSELQLNPGDVMLDMCCGNGIMTARMAEICRTVVGVDFAEPLIAIARKYHNSPNVKYYCMSMLDPKIRTLPERPFSKFYMYESLQYFDEDQLTPLLDSLVGIATSDAVMFFGGVPDADRLWYFYDTEERRKDYLQRKKENREAIGTWWSRKSIAQSCALLGLECEFHEQDPILHSAHYRYDVRIRRLGSVQ